MGALGERFWSHVERGPDCWLWTGYTRPAGYGEFCIGNGQTGYAHRYAYESQVGPIPTGSDIHHLCETPNCVRPDHLVAVPRQVHVVLTPRHHGNKTHCKHGHEFTPENTRHYRGKRICRTCSSARVAKWQRAKANA